MEIIINGTTRAGNFDSVAKLLSADDIDPKTVVVELNGKILPFAEYASRKLADGDVVEIVQFVAGG